MSASRVDLASYARHVLAGMDPGDVHDEAELSAMLTGGSLRAWWAEAGNEALAWCALAPAHGRYVPGAWHLYGAWVRPDVRGRGLARDLWRYRIGLVPVGVPVTVSIQPDKAASLAIARDLGFREVGVAPPWVNFVVRRKPGAHVGP